MRRIALTIGIAGVLSLPVAALANHAEPGRSQGKVYVCKYVGTPGVDERLQTGQNPIEVSVNALEGDGFAGTFPFEFSDAQGRSVAIGYAGNDHAILGIEDCPGVDEPEPTGPEPTGPTGTTGPTGSTGPTGGEPKDPREPKEPKLPRDLAYTGFEAGDAALIGGAFLLAAAAAWKASRKA